MLHSVLQYCHGTYDKLSPSSSEEESYDVGSMPEGDNEGNWSNVFNPMHFPGKSELAYREWTIEDVR